MGALYWVGRGWRVVQGQVTPRDEMEPHDRLDEEVQEGPDAGGSDWTWETWRQTSTETR